MHGITLLSVILAGPVSMTIMIIVMRLLFKESLLFKIGIATGLAIILIAFLSGVIAKIGPIHNLWGFPLQVAIGVSAYVYVNRIIKKPLLNIVNVLDAISEGDLTVKVNGDLLSRNDEIGVLARSTEKLTEKLAVVTTTIANTANQLSSASVQFTSNSEQISEGANMQASSVEEVSASMEEIAANIEQNADNSQQAKAIAKEMKEKMEKVNEAAGRAVNAARAIADKINIISDIAFQTNLLALNAAVEAARAGEHGKGFAVVAAEVRRLAEHSKNAANEIVEISKNSQSLAEESGTLISGLLPEVQQTSLLVEEIAAATQEQRNGINQINAAIQQLNSVTQQNASSSEELASSAEELNAQAEQLVEAIGYFRLDTPNSRFKPNPKN
ncbi:MAG: methyl-accepting chemotaxis protein [Bacteroidota bacterium]